MPKIKNLAMLAAAVEAGRRYAKSNPDKAGQYVDQAAAFVDKQTKGKYTGHIDGAIDKLKGVTGLPRTPRAQGFEANAGYGQHAGYGGTAPVTPPVTPSTTTPTPPPTARHATEPPVTTPPTAATVDPDGTGDRHFPGSKDV